jgi:hypothetical protein
MQNVSNYQSSHNYLYEPVAGGQGELEGGKFGKTGGQCKKELISRFSHLFLEAGVPKFGRIWKA